MFLLYLNIACSLGNKLHTKIRQEGWVDGIIRPSITLFLADFRFPFLCPSADLETSRRAKEKTSGTPCTFPLYFTVRYSAIQFSALL